MTTKKNFSVNPNQSSSESLLKDIRRNTKRIFTSEQKVLIVMEGIRGEQSIAELCRKYGISDSTYYKWNKEFIEAGKARLDGDTIREATSDEVKELRHENIRLKEALADLVVNVSSTNSEQCKLCINDPLYIDARLFWKQAIGSNCP